MKAVRLSTAFDSVTLYGADPGLRPDILGKLGNSGESAASLESLKDAARKGGNLFGELMRAGKYCTLGTISEALFKVGGAYRRNA